MPQVFHILTHKKDETNSFHSAIHLTAAHKLKCHELPLLPLNPAAAAAAAVTREEALVQYLIKSPRPHSPTPQTILSCFLTSNSGRGISTWTIATSPHRLTTMKISAHSVALMTAVVGIAMPNRMHRPYPLLHRLMQICSSVRFKPAEATITRGARSRIPFYHMAAN